MKVGVVAVGNRFAGDDAVGPLVLDAARVELPTGVAAIECDGEPTRLLDAWDGLDAVVLVDAASSGSPVGTVHRLDPDTASAALGAAPRATGTHGAGVAEALALGAVLGRRPDRVVLVAVEARAFSPGDPLSSELERALPAAVAAVLDEVECLGAVPA